MSDSRPTPESSWRERLDLVAGGELPGPLRLVGYGLGLVALAVGAWLFLREPAPPVESTIPRAQPMSTASTSSGPVGPEVIVDVSGAVVRPGLYRLPGGSRIADAVAAAGGAAEGADVERLNLAAPLTDGTKVHVPRVGEPLPAGTATGGPVGPLDLNTATADELDGLPGVGPATAKAIIDARAKRGRFGSVDDLLEIRGIGPAKLDAIRDLVRV
jgi:competence protein ComEA